MTRSRVPRAEVEQRIRDAAIDGRVPYGTFMTLASEYGVTHERIRQIAKGIGIRGTRGRGKTAMRFAIERRLREVSNPAPYGTFAAIARDLNATPSHVVKVAVEMGITASERKFPDLHLVCPECGKPFVYTSEQQRHAIRNKRHGLIRFVNEWLPTCGRTCGVRRGIRFREQRRRNGSRSTARASAPATPSRRAGAVAARGDGSTPPRRAPVAVSHD